MARLGLRRRAAGLRRAVRVARRDVHRAPRGGDTRAGRQGLGQAAGRQPGHSGGAVGRCGDRERRGSGAPGGGAGLPDRDQAGLRQRRQGRARGRECGRARRRAQGLAGRGVEGARPAFGLRRAPAGRGAPGRRAGDRGRVGRCLGARAARGVDPAPPPEAGRGGSRAFAVAGLRRGAAPGRDEAGPRRRLRRRGCHRVPVRRGLGRLLVPRGQRPARGRARGHRDDHRPRPGQAADPRGARWPAARRRARHLRSRDRGAAVRRGPGGRLRAGARHGRPPAPARRARPAGRRRRWGGRPRSGRVRLHDREGRRARPRPRGGARSPGAGAHADGRDPAWRYDEQGLPARPARPRGGAQCPHRRALPRPAGGARRAELAPPRGGGAGARGDRGLRRRGLRREGPLPLERAPRAAGGAARGLAQRRDAAGRPELPPERAAHRGGPLSRRGGRRARRGGRGAAGAARARARAADLGVAPHERRFELPRAFAGPGPHARARGRRRAALVHARGARHW